MSVLERDTLVIYAYGRSRDAGEKHIVAILEALEYIRDTAPRMGISETGVKRTVARWRPQEKTTCLFVEKPNSEHSIIRVPGRDGRMVNARILYTASVGPRPIYPRANAVA
jgi:hypothetical protein